jgi:hypothetical protein
MQWNEISVIIPKLFIYSTIGVLNTLADLVFLLLTGGLGYPCASRKRSAPIVARTWESLNL